MPVRWSRRLCLVGTLLASMSVVGQNKVYVPPELEDWRNWVLHGQEHRRCPFLHDSNATAAQNFVCAWPGKLAIEVATESGTFVQRWTIVGDEQAVPLPGDERIWPRDVTVDGQPTRLTSRQGVPTVRLAPGSHRVAGTFAWRERPARLAVPPRVGLVGLSVDGEPVALPERNDDGLWLGESQQDEVRADALRVEAYRRLHDGMPTRLESVFVIDVAGSVREEVLSPALPEGFTPLALTSALPARLEPNGDLRVQVRPGQWEIVLAAHSDTALDAMTLPAPQSNLPSTEIWSFEASPWLRATLPEAARPVDPTLVDGRWPELPTFRMQASETLHVVERSRGRAGARNDIRVNRQLWLDFDGRGFSFADRIDGLMHTDWRLDMAPPYTLHTAAERTKNLLVTRTDTADDSVGIEMRQKNLDFEALGRIEDRGEIPAAGWRTHLTSMETVLHVPPGAKLLAAFGVDEAPTSWIGRWRLLDFFLVLVVTVAVAQLFGRGAAVVALVALVLSRHEVGAPTWTWLNLLAATAVARVAPPGRLRRAARGYRLGSFALLLILLVTFAANQIRISVYPQLESKWHRSGEATSLFLSSFEATFYDKMDEDDGSYLSRRGPQSPVDERPRLQRIGTYIVQDFQPRVFSRYDDNALVQTGPGKPDWEWTAYPLSWSGPVDADRTMRLLILPSMLTSTLRLVAVVALGLLTALFAFDILGKSWRWPFVNRAASVAISVALVAWIAGSSQDAHADTPPPSILDDLEKRLLAPPRCAPRCAEIVAAEIAIAENELAIELRIHAQAPVAVPVPGSDDGWKPAHASAGSAALALHRDEQGILRIRLNAGRHAVTLRGPLPSADTVEVAFPATPRTIAAHAEHWFVEGIDDGTLPSGALRLTRLRSGTTDEQAPAGWEANRFPPFVTVERHISLGLDWRLGTVVRRLAPSTGAINLSIPLLADEIVVTDQRTVEDGHLQIVLAPTQNTFVWSSSLPRQPVLTLQAPLGQPWHEIWHFEVGSAWQAAFSGVPESAQNSEHRRVATFHPRPGETLTVTLTRPEAVPGNTLSFDEVGVQTTVGAHQRNTQMTLQYRSSRGGSHQIGLPPAARLGKVTINGKHEPLELLDNALNLPILPGMHVVDVAWDETATASWRVMTPTVQLDAPSSNITTTLDMPERWLLFTTGPSMGPAILYWSELIALIVVSCILGRVAPTPLRVRHWLLLGLGFSTFLWFAYGIVAAWLLAHGIRRSRAGAWRPRIYNLSQVAFAALTVAAFAAILTGIPSGLLGDPDMSVEGFQSWGNQLSWFTDQTHDAIPAAVVYSLPMWIYKALILAWALWLAFALMRWLPWVWQCFAERGLWQKTPQKTSKAPRRPDPATQPASEPSAPNDTEKDPWQR